MVEIDVASSSKIDFRCIPNIPIAAIAGFLQRAGTEDYLTLVKAFRRWVGQWH
ncbi:hypothetical protein OOK60_09455 [Trichothermofontia sichuanensis B231]|uniref:hypothetical protein n=1 Tax=Trichothermofontia sichuanensis TaxID=3045816 RepID=UPI0022473247|nr:hypothetical protein OOK60_09455 [Trichothermofontia sichuanensis B231]